jgi:hypothetical protein
MAQRIPAEYSPEGRIGRRGITPGIGRATSPATGEIVATDWYVCPRPHCSYTFRIRPGWRLAVTPAHPIRGKTGKGLPEIVWKMCEGSSKPAYAIG